MVLGGFLGITLEIIGIAEEKKQTNLMKEGTPKL
jgi:hypothetical protein